VTSKTSAAGQMPTLGDDLTVLRADFPGYKIWQEHTPGRARYVARSLRDGLNPHTVVTSDLAELRDTLGPARSAEVMPFTPDQPNIARMYDYWLRGKDHYSADRAAADEITGKFPEVAQIAQANRAFLARAVRHVARQGITQFLDLGSGLPTSPNTHEIARGTAPDARVCYVDHDPVVLAHARALLAIDDNVSVAAGDIRNPPTFLADPAITHLIDPATPICVLLVSVLHFLTADEADAAVPAVRHWMAPGSYLVISAGSSTGTDPELVSCLQEAYGDTAPVTGRTAREIAAWFDGFSLARPGLVNVWAWRPTGPQRLPRHEMPEASFLGGVGRKLPLVPGWQP
jgi:O-methyltransferase involved in polyketide biosynthesis